MDSDFVEKCRLLKQHFTKLTPTDTGQSAQQTSVVGDIINDAKKLLFYEQLDALSDPDIARLRQNSVLKYARTLENYMPTLSLRKCESNSATLTQPLSKVKRNFNSKLHTILENQTENKENDEMWEETQMKMKAELEDIQNAHTDTKMKQQYSTGQVKIEIESEKLYNTNMYVDKEIEDIMKQYENYFQTPIKVTDKYYNRQSKMEAMKKDCDRYYNVRTKIGDDIEAMRKECADMEEMMRNVQENEKIKSASAYRKVEKEVCLVDDPRVERKAEILEEKDNRTRRRRDKTDTVENVPELRIRAQPQASIVELLAIKKLQIENMDGNQTFDTPQIDNETLLKSTLCKWRKFAADNRTTRATSKTSTKIENFLENLEKFKLSNSRKAKSDLHATDQHEKESITVKTNPKSSNTLDTRVSSFEHRFKAQKDIIARQKAKLTEQNKLIEELKLTRIQKEARQSLQEAKSALEKTVHQSVKYKYRVKQPEPDTEQSDPIGVAFSLNLSKAPKLVQLMEDRAKEREEKRMLIKERKRLIEEEKKRHAEEAIEQKMRDECAEKHQRLVRMKRQRELTRQLELRKQMEKKRFITINQLAYEHYRRTLLKNYGMKHFRMLVYNVKINMEIGKRFYENNIVMRCYYSWKKHAQEIMAEKTNRAVRLYEHKMKVQLMNGWKKILLKVIQGKQVAIDRYEMNLQNKTFIYWHRLVCEYHIQHRINAQRADQHYKRVLLFQCLHSWRSLPDIMQIERVQNERKRKWRLRVAEILSDYDPLKCYN